MILYQLRCAGGHEFEAWFRDAATYDEQVGARGVSCPFCGGKKITKAPMAPRLAKGASRSEAVAERANEVATHIFQAAAKLRQHIEENCDFVGEKFAEEARRIHYGETEAHGIYGTATDDEASDLTDEGIEFSQVKWFPRRND